MSDQQKLRDLLRPGLEAVIAPSKQRRLAAISSAFDNTGNLKPEALGGAVLLKCDLEIIGAAANGTNVARPSRMPQAARIVRIDAYAMTPPAGGEFTAVLTANGATVDSVSIAAGQNISPGTAVPASAGAIAAGVWLGLNVTADNGAADIAITVTYRVV